MLFVSPQAWLPLYVCPVYLKKYVQNSQHPAILDERNSQNTQGHNHIQQAMPGIYVRTNVPVRIVLRVPLWGVLVMAVHLT